MKSIRTKDFRKLFEALPKRTQRQAKAAFQRFKRAPDHPGLNFKLIHPEKQVYSVRVGLHYRALGRRRGDEMLWFWIGTHAEYDKAIEHL